MGSRAERSHGRPRHIHPDHPSLNPLQQPKPRHHIDLHWSLQHPHRRNLRRPHARPAHEINCSRRHIKIRFRRPGDHGRRNLHRRSSIDSRSNRIDAIDVQINPSLRRQRNSALPRVSFRLHRS
ncbi:hypothetical protein LINGRAHAP2_LOCUS8683 [Linum grandiflorum]